MELVTDELPPDTTKLLHDFDPGSGERRESVKTRICYNSNCPDYKRERTEFEDCGCKRTKIVGGGR